MKDELPIHVARIQPNGPEPVYLFLRKIGEKFCWMEGEKETEVIADTQEDAIRMAWKYWKPKNVAFRMVHCGFWFSLPEREEHGIPAMFNQMAASYSTPMGVYFDEQFGHQAAVKEASSEALDLWREIRQS